MENLHSKLSDTLTIWRPLDVFNDSNSSNYAFILLNQPINEKNENYLIKLWSKSMVKLCADGASNRLYEWCYKNNCLNSYIPDYICGDLDSIRNEVKDFYKSNGSKIIRLYNQDFTDFTKTLKFAINCIKNLKKDHDVEIYGENGCKIDDTVKHVNFEQIYVFCTFTGRFDHALANLNSLYMINKEFLLNIFIISEESITFLLNKGVNLIYTDNSNLLGKYCGYFPLSYPSHVTTTGLKWNLNNQLCSFDGLISSSNEFDFNDNQNYVHIETENPLLWTMSINKIV